MLIILEIRIRGEKLFPLLPNQMAQFEVLIRDLFKMNRSRSFRALPVSREDFNIFRAFPVLLCTSVRITGHAGERETVAGRKERKQSNILNDRQELHSE